jgi:hypothetical protein
MVQPMKLLKASSAALVGMALCSAVYAYQRTADFGFDDDAETNVKAEFYWSRLSYTSSVGSSFAGGYGGGYGGYGGYGWGRSWSRDYPKADRQVLMAMKRLTLIQTRSTEQVVDLDSDKIFDYPWVYAVQVQTWSFTDFMEGMRQVFPDRPIEDLDNKDEIFHVLYDLDERMQVPGEQYIRTGRTYEKDGYVPKWRAIRDDKGRIIVAICHNMHLGDAWEWADDPDYPEPFASMAFRVGLNYIVYGMTH